MTASFSIQNVDSIELSHVCDHGTGGKSFRFVIPTKCPFYGKGEAQIILFANTAFVPKLERIAAAITAIMAEPDEVAPALADAAE